MQLHEELAVRRKDVVAVVELLDLQKQTYFQLGVRLVPRCCFRVEERMERPLTRHLPDQLCFLIPDSQLNSNARKKSGAFVDQDSLLRT